MNRKSFYILFLFFGSSIFLHAQPGNITVKGTAVTSQGLGGLYQVIVINQRTSQGLMAEPSGYFTLSCLKTDTLLVSASGFTVKKICFRDSVQRQEYHVVVHLDSIHYNLAEVKVYPGKTLRQVDEEKNGLGDIPNTDRYKDINALGSPIEYLYERFSRIEQSKRKVAELEDEQKRRDVLKELFHIYIQHDIINLSDQDFERFIDYCDFTDDFIKNASDYDLVMAIKYKYQQFEKMRDYVPPADNNSGNTSH